MPEKLHTCQYIEHIYIVRFRVGDTIQVQLAYIQSKYNDLKSNTTTELYTKCKDDLHQRAKLFIQDMQCMLF